MARTVMLRPREPERCQIHWAVTKHPKQRKKRNSVRENREKKGEAQEYDSLKSDLKFESECVGARRGGIAHFGRGES